MSEDCLYLNVFAPPANKTPVGDGHAVMVFLYGGAFWWGGTDYADYDGRWMIALSPDVVVVTVAYRLGVFGWLGSDALRERAANGGTGNYGMLDQRAALRWVQRNIAGFGGDPARVMLYGQSSGGASVAHHVVSPHSRGLFSRAGLMSGGFGSWAAMSMEAAEEGFNRVASALNCSGGGVVACLVAKDTDSVLRAGFPPGQVPDGDVFAWEQVPCRDGSPWEPVVDGIDVADYPWRLLERGEASAAVPVLIGVCRDDGGDFVDDVEPLNPECGEEEYDRWVGLTYQKRSRFFSLTAELRRLYPPRQPPQQPRGAAHRRRRRRSDPPGASGEVGTAGRYSEAYSGWYFSAVDMQTDALEWCPMRRTSRALAAAGVPVYEYAFTYEEFAGYPFVDHGCEQPYIFYYPWSDPYTPWTPELHNLGQAVVGYWTNFAKAGDPNGPAPNGTRLPQWPRCTAELSHTQLLSPHRGCGRDARGAVRMVGQAVEVLLPLRAPTAALTPVHQHPRECAERRAKSYC